MGGACRCSFPLRSRGSRACGMTTQAVAWATDSAPDSRLYHRPPGRARCRRPGPGGAAQPELSGARSPLPEIDQARRRCPVASGPTARRADAGSPAGGAAPRRRRPIAIRTCCAPRSAIGTSSRAGSPTAWTRAAGWRRRRVPDRTRAVARGGRSAAGPGGSRTAGADAVARVVRDRRADRVGTAVLRDRFYRDDARRVQAHLAAIGRHGRRPCR